MESRASFHKHPIHPMLVALPIGLWVFSLICDLVYVGESVNNLFWRDVAFYTMTGGVVGALLAAVPGFIDYLSIRDYSTRKTATAHMVLNLCIVALFIFNLGLRLNPTADSTVLTIALSAVGIVVLMVSGWLGGSLIYVHGVAVPAETQDRVSGKRAA